MRVLPLIAVLFAALLAIASISSAIEGARCDAVFYQLPQTGNKDIDQVLGLISSKYHGKDIDRLWESNPVQKYLQKNGITESYKLSDFERIQWLGKYLHGYLSPYRNETLLEKKRERAWKRALRFHGYESDVRLTARQNIEELSRSNRMRIMGNETYISTPEMKEAEEVVNNLEPFLAHNSHIMREAPRYPVIAPSEIEKMGLPDFSMSSMEFNRFIGSTDHVYFFIKFRNNKGSSKMRSEYGEYGVVVKNEYAQKTAWVSPFIMYRYDLYAASRKADPEVAEAFKKKMAVIDKDGNESWNSRYGRVDHQAEILQALKTVHKFDFTVSDFESIVKTQLLISLRKLKSEEPDKYISALKIIEKLGTGNEKNDKEAGELFYQLVYRPLKMPSYFEGRIPVAVPDTELVHFAK